MMPNADANGSLGVNLTPSSAGVSANVTVGHTWLIIVGAIALLWLLGMGVFRGIRL